ncbi:MAG: hypothetical protein WC819_03430 [Parcubacteria group bacterium]|jgi:hypothetical protein
MNEFETLHSNDQKSLVDHEKEIINTKNQEKAREILSFPEEHLKSLSDEEKRDLISDLRWHVFEKNGARIHMPEEMLEAESRIYELYTPSKELQDIHKICTNEALHAIEESLLDLNKKWIGRDTSGRLEMCQEWANQLCASYKIPKITVFDAGRTITADAIYYEGFGDLLGTIGIGRGKLEHNENLKDFLDAIAHEIAHAFQCATVRDMESEEIKEKIANDIAWFTLQKRRSMCRDDSLFKGSHKRYLSLPSEQDAHGMQGDFSKRSAEVFSAVKNAKLREYDLPDLQTIIRQAGAARWVNNILSLEKDIDGEELMKKAQERLPESGQRLIEKLFGNVTNNELKKLGDEFLKTEERSKEILYGEVNK